MQDAESVDPQLVHLLPFSVGGVEVLLGVTRLVGRDRNGGPEAVGELTCRTVEFGELGSDGFVRVGVANEGETFLDLE